MALIKGFRVSVFKKTQHRGTELHRVPQRFNWVTLWLSVNSVLKYLKGNTESMNNSLLQLKKLITTHYKNLVINPNQEIELQPLTILIGANGSGKSNLISVLKFLQDCVTPIDGSQGVTAYQQAVINQLGGSKLLDGHLPYPANATYVFELTDNQTLPSLRFEFTLHAKDTMSIPFIIEESFSQHQIEPFD